MTEEKLNQSEEVEEETPETKPEDGSGSEEMSDEEFEALFKDDSEESDDSDDSKEESKSGENQKEESEDDFLERYNAEFGTNFKSVEAIKESQKNLRRAVSEKGQAKKEEQTFLQKYAEDVLLARHPEAEFVIDELKEEAERTGKDIIDLYKSSTFIQKEAKARAEEEQANASKKVNVPDAGSSAKQIDFSRMTSEQFKRYKEMVQSRA